ncbi:unnamed protein product [Scytosiphon promiscuus]
MAMTACHRSCRRSRLLPSLALFASFFLLGVFISALGPSVPSLSRDLEVTEVSFGMAFSLRGLGYLMGSWGSSLTLPVGRLANGRWLNDRMIRLGAATGGIGFFALALDMAFTFWLASAACFCQGLCGGALDAIANAAISVVHGTDVAPWMQGLHFCFSAGALFAPAAVGRLGYRAVFITFGLLAQPVGLACCLSSGAAAVAAAEAVGGRGEAQLLGDEEAEMKLSTVDGGGDDGGDFCSDGNGDGGVVHGNADHVDGVSMAATSTSGGDIEMVQGLAATGKAAKKPDVRGPDTAHDSVGTEDHRHCQPNESVDSPLHPGEKEGEAALKPPTSSLVVLLALLFFLYVGIEVGFGAWIAVVVLRDHLAAEAGAALMASLFWGGITVGRLLAIPLSVRFSVDFLVKVNLGGSLLSSAVLWSIGRDGIAFAAVGAVLFGLFMASTYPLAMSLLPSAGYLLSDKNSSRFVVGGAMGEMMVPALIALLLGPGGSTTDGDGDDNHESGRPASLYGVCLAVSALLVAVYGTWRGLIASPATTVS